jgi:hypothetical protein
MLIEGDLARFLSEPVTIILGATDAGGRPEIGRGLAGAVVAEDMVEMVLSRTQWPATAANVVGTCRLSATFTRPADYVSYQLKGSASVRLAEAEDRGRAERYITEMRATFAVLGLAPDFVDAWLQTEDPVVLRLAVEAVFVQTPGLRAGVALT